MESRLMRLRMLAIPCRPLGLIWIVYTVSAAFCCTDAVVNMLNNIESNVSNLMPARLMSPRRLPSTSGIRTAVCTR